MIFSDRLKIQDIFKDFSFTQKNNLYLFIGKKNH